ncbi:MAG: tail fiber domain-containing protein [Acidobacteriota bacterium]
MTKTLFKRSLIGLAAAALLAAPIFANSVSTLAGSTSVQWNADFANAGMKLTVTGPNGYVLERTFAGNASFSIFDDEGYSLADGRYNWRVTVLPRISDQVRQDLEAARAYGDDAYGEELKRSGAIQSAVAEGVFAIAAGALVTPSEDVEPRNAPPAAAPDAVAKSVQGDAQARAQVFATDLVVQGSTCLGVDCTTSESFGSDTVRLKENNLRIHFNDTSASANFPSNDWRLQANDSTNGGAEYFAIADATNNKTPFRIEANAPNHTVYASSEGRIGNKTSTPVVDIHIVEGNSPTLRLEQDGSDGFQTQTWDLAGNEANFFLRDVTNSSKLPFRVKPGAPDDSIFIAASGNVGFGLDNPSDDLHVKETAQDEPATVLVEQTNATSGSATIDVKSTNGAATITVDSGSSDDATRELLVLQNNGLPRLVLDNSATDNGDGDSTNGDEADGRWFFGLNGTDSFVISLTGSPSNELKLDGNGSMTIRGTLTESSDINVKNTIEQVDPRQVLATLVELPISTWSYNADAPGIRHMGPMAQDFHAAFGLGATETGIATVDKDGVAMAAIQGLHSVVTEKQNEVDELKARVAALEAMIQAMAEANGQ